MTDARAALVTTARRCASALLVLAAGVLPFELPLFGVGPIGVTSVELVLYLLLAAFGLHVALAAGFVARGRSLLRDPLARAAILWAVVVFVSAFAAPTDRAASIKFALRTLCGVLVFFAARSLGREPRVARGTVCALVLGGLVSAATALGESWIDPVAAIFDCYRDGTFGAFALRRASGVFAYPTIGAVYWEAAIPLVVVLPFAVVVPRRVTPRVALVAVAALFAAIVASGTRSGLAGGGIASVALFVVTRAWNRPLAWTAASSLGALVVVSVLSTAFAGAGSPLRERLAFWHDDDWFRVTYEGTFAPRRVAPGEELTTPLRLHNAGSLTWHAGGEQRTTLGHHWYRHGEAGALRSMGQARSDLPHDVASNDVVDVVGTATAPTEPGRYRLAWDLVEEHVTWFSQHGNAMPAETVVVGDAPMTDDVVANDEAPDGGPQAPSRPVLWRGAVALFRQHPLFGIGPDNFRRRYGEVIPPDANGAPYADARIHANSLYFETLADLGLVGLVALALLGFGWLGTFRAHLRTRSVMGLGLATAAGTFFVHGVSDYFLEFTPTYGLFWMLLGLSSASLEASPREPPRSRA